MNNKNYLIIDQDTMSCEYLKLLIKSIDQQSKIHIAASIIQSKATINQPDCIDHLLIKLDHTIIDPVALMGQIKSWLRHCTTLVITNETSSDFLHKLLENGANLVSNNRTTQVQIKQTLRKMISAPVNNHEHTGRIQNSTSKLTQRQKQVMAGMLRGQANKRIAWELGISEGTIKLHVSSILRALNARNRTEAALKFQQLEFNKIQPGKINGHIQYDHQDEQARM